MTKKTIPAIALSACAIAPTAMGQYDPANAQWGKDVDTDIRIVTWNIEDTVCSTETKTTSSQDWDGVVRTIAMLRPDVLLLQEAGDNSGNGTGGGVDSVSTLTTVVELLLRGGTDPFRGGAVSSYVQLYAPGFDMPYIFVTSDTDNFNRNVIVSRFPFADLNGNGQATYGDIAMLQDSTVDWNRSGDGGIRGQQVVEIDLPNDTYLGDLVVGNAHLKSGGGSSDFSQRDTAARNASYFVYYQYNGAGTGTPDPNNRILGAAPTTVLDANTPVVWGGDWNQEGAGGGFRGPAAWFEEGLGAGGLDGTDADNTDATIANAANPFTGSLDTLGSSRLDYIMFQDSIATERNSFVVNTGNFGTAIPPELIGYSPSPLFVSNRAADHRAVGVDLILPLGMNGGGDPTPPGDFFITSPIVNTLTNDPATTISWEESTDAATYDIEVLGPNATTPFSATEDATTTTRSIVVDPALDPCETYAVNITAVNEDGSTDATNSGLVFTIRGLGDVTTEGATLPGQPGFGVPDGLTTLDDLGYYLNLWLVGNLEADLTTSGATLVGQPGFGVPDGLVELDDLGYFLNFWLVGCP
ncbi:MAG: GC-type dockerin domain-anchored protein [Planctomycetota bacterium]